MPSPLQKILNTKCILDNCFLGNNIYYKFINPFIHVESNALNAKDVENDVEEKCGQWISGERWIYNGAQRSAEYGKHCRGPGVTKYLRVSKFQILQNIR